jgi:hypothetical protein
LSPSLSIEIAFPYAVAYRGNLEVIVRTPTQIFCSIPFPLAGIYLLYLTLSSNAEIGLTQIVAIICCFFFTPIMLAFGLFMARRRNPLAKGPFRLTFDESGILTTNKDFSMTFKWSAIQKVRMSSHFIFFFHAPGRATSVPCQQLNPDDLNALKAIARANVADTNL